MNKTALIEEIADVMTVLEAIMFHLKLPEEDLDDIYYDKIDKKGDFSQFMFMINRGKA